MMVPHTLALLGSPPHMRGKVKRYIKELPPLGITPAYAGKSCFGTGCSEGRKDHPRICGEKSMPPRVGPRSMGSPPHMRGKALKMGAQAREVGITPAYAGKRLSSSFDTFHPQDHPRICGEKKGNSEMIAINLGSPPHMRGKDAVLTLQRVCLRITPAYAGKRRAGPSRPHRPGDHPRICGEKGCWQIKRARCEGSPPHMRGKAVFLRFSGLVPGITPAYAGKSPQRPG